MITKYKPIFYEERKKIKKSSLNGKALITYNLEDKYGKRPGPSGLNFGITGLNIVEIEKLFPGVDNYNVSPDFKTEFEWVVADTKLKFWMAIYNYKDGPRYEGLSELDDETDEWKEIVMGITSWNISTNNEEIAKAILIDRGGKEGVKFKFTF